MFLEIQPDSWDAARHAAGQMIRWAFRGQADDSWPLSTTIEREGERFDPVRYVLQLKNREEWILRNFQRRAHDYIPSPPPIEHRFEWLALLQLHGGPTRLLDFTHSFYVAAFFAIERADRDAAVWAVDLRHLEQKVCEATGRCLDDERIDMIQRRHAEVAQEIIQGQFSPRLVLNVEPERLSERQSTQQSLFLMPGNIEETFAANLFGREPSTAEPWKPSTTMPYKGDGSVSEDLSEYSLIKIHLPRSVHKRALGDLWRMNVNAATLFPGLDGFARSLSYWMRTLDFA